MTRTTGGPIRLLFPNLAIVAVKSRASYSSLFSRVHCQPTMPIVLPPFFRIIFIYLEPSLTLAGAYSAFVSPEWYLASQIPGPTVSGLLHTIETVMAIRLYGVLLTLLATISWAVFPVVAKKSDALSFSVARRLLFVLAGIVYTK